MELGTLEKQLVEKLSSSSSTEKTSLVSKLILNLTFIGRVIYSDKSQDQDVVEDFYTLNEVQNTCAGFLLRQLFDEEYTASDFASNICDFSKERNFQRHLALSIKNTLSAD